MKFIIIVIVLLAFTLTQTQEDYNIGDPGCLTSTEISREDCNKRTATTAGMECCSTTATGSYKTSSTCYAIKKNETSLKNFYNFLYYSLELTDISILCSSSFVKIATIAFTSLFCFF